MAKMAPTEQGPHTVVVVSGQPRDCHTCCFECDCDCEDACLTCWCACDSGEKWYSLKGKGICCILLLLPFYLVVGSILVPLYILYFIGECLHGNHWHR